MTQKYDSIFKIRIVIHSSFFGEGMLNDHISRKQREFLHRRQEIMQTALSLFCETGFSNVSMQEIAAKSEYAVGTLYKFFPTKEALYSEVLKEKVLELHSILIAALSIPGSEIKKMRSFLEKKILWFKKNMDYVRLYITETFGVGFVDKRELDPIKEKVHLEQLRKIADIFQSGIEKKVFKDIDPDILSVSLNGLSNGLLFELIENKNFGQFDSKTVLKIFLQSICLNESDEIGQDES